MNRRTLIAALLLASSLGCGDSREATSSAPGKETAASPPAPKVKRLRVTPSEDGSPPTIALDTSPPRRGSRDEQEDTTIYKVVRNHEEQYSIWPAERENALGWNDAGKSGTKTECLEYIKEVWTDMRPLSLRKRMEQAASEN